MDNLEEIVVGEFERHKGADVFIFHLDTDDKNRQQKKYKKTRKYRPLERMPWGGVRIAVKLDSLKKANVWFTTLFGGGCIFPSGEDSLFLKECKRKGLKFYVSEHTIGKVSFEESTWFTGFDEKYYYAKGCFYKAIHSKTFSLWTKYFAFRTRKVSNLSLKDKLKWMKHGAKGYKQMLSFEKYKEKYIEKS